MNRFRMLLAGAMVCGFGMMAARGPGIGAVGGAEQKGPDKAAVDRTREQVKMLDDLYKTNVVFVTKTYVDQQGDAPAAILTMELFEAMKKKGWHDARLIDASGKPKRQENVAKTPFEKKAVTEIQGGKAYYEEIGEKDGKPVLRAATVVPAVMKQCAACHRVKEGDLLGAIVYEVPIK